jgi:hypothetical protein
VNRFAQLELDATEPAAAAIPVRRLSREDLGLPPPPLPRPGSLTWWLVLSLAA